MGDAEGASVGGVVVVGGPVVGDVVAVGGPVVGCVVAVERSRRRECRGCGRWRSGRCRSWWGGRRACGGVARVLVECTGLLKFGGGRGCLFWERGACAWRIRRMCTRWRYRCHHLRGTQ